MEIKYNVFKKSLTAMKDCFRFFLLYGNQVLLFFNGKKLDKFHFSIKQIKSKIFLYFHQQ